MSSGTYSFGLTANDLVNAALRQTGRYASYDTIPTADVANVLQALNIIVKAMVKNQLPLWCVQQLTVPLVTGTATYNLSTISGTARPLRIIGSFVRNVSGNDVQIEMLARTAYNMTGSKTTPGNVIQAYYDPQLGAASLTVYNVPADSTHTLFLDIQRPIQDFNLLTDNPDFPQEAFHLLKWALADEIALEYLTPADMRQTISQKSVAAYAAFFAGEREEVSTFLTPTDRWQ